MWKGAVYWRGPRSGVAAAARCCDQQPPPVSFELYPLTLNPLMEYAYSGPSNAPVEEDGEEQQAAKRRRTAAARSLLGLVSGAGARSWGRAIGAAGCKARPLLGGLVWVAEELVVGESEAGAMSLLTHA